MSPPRFAELRMSARSIFEAGLAAADPYRLLEEGFRILPGEGFRFGDDPFVLPLPGPSGRVRLFGAGKAAGSLARALEERLSQGGVPVSGRIVVKHGHAVKLEHVVVEEGGHPLPDEAGAAATKRLLTDLADGRSEDRIFFLLTGGASSLLVAPAPGIALEDQIATTNLLLRAGATIRELNAVRKHLSAVKGGRLLERMAPAKILAFVVSDVIGDDLSSIGSGPATPDPTTFEDCLRVVSRYRLEDSLPATVRERLQGGARGLVPETPKPESELFARVHHVILASNRMSLSEARKKAIELGFDAEIFRRDMEGEVHEVAREFAARLVSRAASPGRFVLLAGGELTLRVQGTGRGGRNQELALVVAREIRGHSGIGLLAAGTDGTDGPTDAAGAFADGETWERARRGGIDPDGILADNDSYRLFDRLGDLLRTGPTGTNVNDLVIGIGGIGGIGGSGEAGGRG
jgi:glycerate 2-kinase